MKRCRDKNDRREEATGIKMLMQLHGFTRDREIGGMKDIVDTLKRLSKDSEARTIEMVKKKGSVPATYVPADGTRRPHVIEIPKEAKR